MHSWRWSGSEFEPATGIPLEDRGFRYGMAVFESIRLRTGRPLFLEAHLQRLRAACLDRGFSLDPAAISGAGALLQTIGADGFARLYVTAGPGAIADRVIDSGLYLLFEPRFASARRSYALVLGQETFHPLFGGLKTANYWPNVHQIQQAAALGADEALLFNSQAELVSACLANVFLVHGSRIRTPALPCGARNGVIREWVLQRAVVEECSLFVDDAQSADEIFLTNSWIGIMPAREIEGRPLQSTAVSSGLAERYEAEIS